MAITKEFKMKVTVEGDKKDFAGLTDAAKDYAAGVQKLSDNLNQVGKAAKSNALMFTELNSAIELGKRAFDLIATPIGKSITAFLEAEQAQSKLRNSLVALGFDAEGAMADLERFASEIQRTTTMSDDMALELASVSKSMGLTNAQTKEIIKASIGLSTAIGVDVRTAFNDLTGQLNGVAGRTAKYVTGLKDLTEEQLKAGDGLKLASQQYERFAALSAGTLTGSIEQAKNAFGDMFEETGRVASELIDLPNLTRAATQAFLDATASIRDFGDRLISIKNEMANIPFDEIIAALSAIGATIAGVIAIVKAGAISTGFTAMVVAIKAATVAAIVLAAKIALIAAAVMGVILAIDFLVANFDRVKLAADIVFKSIEVAIASIKLGFMLLIEIMLGGLRQVIAGMSMLPGMSDSMLKGFDASMANVAKQTSAAKEELKGLTGEVANLTTKLFSAQGAKAGKVWLGLSKGIEAVKKGFSATNMEAKKTEKTFNDVNKQVQSLTPNLKEAEKKAKELESKIKDLTGEIKNLEKQTEALKIEEEKRGKNLVEIVRIEEKYALQAAENLRKRLKDLGVEDKALESIIDNYKKAVNVKANFSALDAQEKMDKERADKRKTVVSEIEKAGPVGAFIGMKALEAGELIQNIMAGTGDGLAEMLKVTAGFFKRNFAEITDEQLQAFAIMSSQMFTNWRNFIAGIGAAIGFSINNLDALFRGVGDGLSAAFTEGGKMLDEYILGFKDFSVDLGLDEAFKELVGVSATEFGKEIGDQISYTVKEIDWGLEEIFGEATENFAAAFGWFGQMMGQTLDTSIQFLQTIFSGDYINKFADVTETMVNFPNAIMESFGKIQEQLAKGTQTFLIGLSKLINDLPKIAVLIAQELPKVLHLFAQALPMIMRQIVNIIPTIFQALLDVLPTLISSLSQVVIMFIEMIPQMVDQVAKALPRIIAHIFEAIPRAMQAVMKAIPSIIENIAENMDEIVLAFVEGFIAAMGEIVGSFIDEFILGGGLERVLGAIMRAIPRIIIALIQGIVRGVLKALKGISKGIFGDIELPPAIANLPKNIEKAADKLGKKIAKDASQIFTVKNLEESVKGGGAVIAEQAQFLGEMIDSAGRKLGGTLGEWLVALKRIWDGIIQMFVDLGNFIMDGLDRLGRGIAASWLNLIEQLITAGKKTFEPIGQFINKFGDVVFNAVNKFMTFAPKIGEQIFVGLRDSIFGEGSVFTDAGKQIWDGLKQGFENPISGLSKLLNSILPTNLFGKMFDASAAFAGEPGAVEKALGINVPFMNFATGGVVRGSAQVAGDSLLNDRILALLSPGEAIIPRSLMGDPAVASLVNLILSGKITPPAFALGTPKVGGAIGQVGGAISQGSKDSGLSGTAAQVGEILASLDPTQLWARVKDKVFKEMFWELLKMNTFHDGGIIGGAGDVPILGQAGEFVVNRRATQNNRALLSQINNGAAIGNGGFVIENITINAQTHLDADGIRREVIPAIERHLKRRSQDGEFVLSARGVRDK